VPLGAGSSKAPPEPSVTQRAERRNQRARQLARRRVAALACLLGALVALTAGAYLLIAPARTRKGPAAPTETAPGAVKAATSHVRPTIGACAKPSRLIIPKIGLDAVVEYVGLTTNNAMAAPSGPDTVGWYSRGPHPGDKGSAVIDGHSGYANGEAAAFDKLPELSKGDRLYVEDAHGKVATFIVSKTQLYARDADAAGVFTSAENRCLNLITCTGSFDVVAGTHSQRLVVFTVLETPKRPAS
jgi:LPXTG-site transpeptidase (sortase) family protein